MQNFTANDFDPAAAHLSALQKDFREDLPGFLKAAQVPMHRQFGVVADPVYFVTGAAFTGYNVPLHGADDAHALYDGPTPAAQPYLMNNTAALLQRLMDDGRRVLVHGSTPEIVETIVRLHPHGGKVRVIGGDLGAPKILEDVYENLEVMHAEQPIENVRMALYQSFAAGGQQPFKPMHRESLAEVERAASRRLRFVFNMTAMAYDLLVNRNFPEIRIVALSALASRRPTYGLLADAADKFMNELAWKTFHIESNASTGKPVTVIEVKPGITAACDVYRRDGVRQTVNRESVADGFPMDDAVLCGQAPLPQLSARDVADVASAMLTTPFGQDPNHHVSPRIRPLLYGGYSPEEFRDRFNRVIRIDADGIAIDPDRVLPEHILAPGTHYGALPRAIKPGEYKSISMCPPGQRF